MANISNKVFLDTNVVMEVLFQRGKRADLQKLVMSLPDRTYLAISVLTVGTVFYYAERAKIAKTRVHDLLSEFIILDMGAEDYDWAVDNDQNDFEDALQVACALRHDCSKLITLDKGLAKNHRKHIVTKLVQ